MKTKWEYIAFRCEKKGFRKSAKIAKQIDKILKELYEERHTVTWKREYQSLDFKAIYSIAEDSYYCVACVKHDDMCEECKFGELTGICGYDSSLFKRFLDTFLAEGGDLT